MGRRNAGRDRGAGLSGPAALPQALVEHELPGRLRLRVPSRRGDRPFFEAVSERIAGLAGVRRVRANPLTGSLLVEHATSAAAIAALAREHGSFDLIAPGALPAPREVPAAPARPAVLPDPLSLAAAGLAGAGAYQLARGRVLGSASENLWNAYGAYAVLKQPWTAVVLVGFGLYQLAAGQGLGSAVSLFLYALNARHLARGQAPEAAV